MVLCPLSYQHAFLKNIIKIGEFYVAILILKVEKTCNIFGILCFIKKGKNAAEMQKFVQCLEKAL